MAPVSVAGHADAGAGRGVGGRGLFAACSARGARDLWRFRDLDRHELGARRPSVRRKRPRSCMAPGNWARRMNLPFRSGGGLCGSKLPDAQAAYETANTLNAALLARGELHAARLRLAGGRAGVVLREIRAGCGSAGCPALDRRRGGCVSKTRRAMDAIREVGPGESLSGLCSTRRRISSRPSGGPKCWTTSRSRPGPTRAVATARRWPRPGWRGCWVIIRPRRSIPASRRRWRPMSPSARGRCPTPFAVSRAAQV